MPPSRVKSAFVAFAVGIVAAAGTYKVLRNVRPGSDPSQNGAAPEAA